MALKRMSDLDLKDKRVLIRQDLNVPIKDGCVSNEQRIKASLPTIKAAQKAGARIMLMSHLGRPTEGKYEDEFSLAPVAGRLSSLLGEPVLLVKNWLDGFTPEPGQVMLCENVRFNKGEKADDEALAKKMASLCDVYVMDAFGTAHRAQASTHGVAKFAPEACAGPLLAGELDALAKALDKPRKPVVAIVGGSKVSTKLTVLESLSGVVDNLIVGGGIANTFIAAAGHPVGKSLYEADLVPEAKRLMAAAKAGGGEIPVPVDVVVAKEFSEDAPAAIKPVAEVAEDDMILDIGPLSARDLADRLAKAGTIVWNGPMIAEAIARSPAFSIAGGGDTLAAVDKYNIAEKVSYISTGGGAFLEFLEGKKLPAVAMLESRGR